MDFPGGSDGKASVYNVGDLGSIPGSGRSPGEGNGNSLQPENPMDRGAWQATVHGVAKSRTRPNDQPFTSEAPFSRPQRRLSPPPTTSGKRANAQREPCPPPPSVALVSSLQGASASEAQPPVRAGSWPASPRLRWRQLPSRGNRTGAPSLPPG